jgi:Zn-dependent metalloprotease
MVHGSPCFIVPPHLLERVARTGTEQEREAALQTLALDASLGAARLQRAVLGGSREQEPFAAPGGKPQRVIYDARHREDVHAATVLRLEGDAPVRDRSADQAYDGLGDAYRFFWDVLRRDSIDDAGMRLLGEVHFARDYDNAFWDGERMIFGDGDGRLFTGFTRAVDVIGHELAHGVVQHTIGLRYLGQPGALNESIADVFGTLVKQYTLGQSVEQADWLVGGGILGPALHGHGLRSLAAPGTAFEGDPQPAHMRDYHTTVADNGAVHINSGIPNHAFYLFAMELGGRAWERAGEVWYDVLAGRRVDGYAGFAAFALATVRAAEHRFGHASPEERALADAWSGVGVLKTVRVAVA